MKIKIALKLFVVFVLGFLFGIGIKYVYESTAFKPYNWQKAPVIVNCYGDDFSETQFLRAIHYWTIRGHSIAFYEHNPPESICDTENHIEGFIILRKGKRFDHESAVLAHTKRWTSLTALRGAVITYRPGTQNLMWINEHELGHALGYSHIEEEGHIMHPLFHKMAGKFWIP